MSCSVLLVLPDRVQFDHVTGAMAALLGNPIRRGMVDTTETVVCIPGITLRVNLPSVFMVNVSIRDAREASHTSTYFFESPYGGRLLTMDSNPVNIAMARRLADIFGGKVVYRDVDGGNVRKPDYQVPAFRYNGANDNPGFAKMQERLLAVTPLTADEIEQAAPHAGYPEWRQMPC